MTAIDASLNEYPKVIFVEGAAPSTPPAGMLYVYAKADGLLYQKDDTGAESPLSGDVGTHLADTSDAHDASAISIADAGTYFTGTDVEAALQELGAVSGGLADQGAFTYLDATEAAAPATPASGKVRIYAKSDGRVYSKDDGGVEYGPFDVGGGSDPRAYPAAYTLDALSIGSGIEFDDAAGTPSGMSVLGTIGSGDNVSMPGLDLILDAGDHYYIADPGGNLEVMLHFSGTYDEGGMYGVGFIDNSGNGHCFVQYQDTLYQMAAASAQYSGTGASQAKAVDNINTWGHQWIAVKRVGTTLTARMSVDGTAAGFSAATTGVTNSTSTRIAIGRWYSGNGGKKMRIHRLVIAAPNLGV